MQVNDRESSEQTWHHEQEIQRRIQQRAIQWMQLKIVVWPEQRDRLKSLRIRLTSAVGIAERDSNVVIQRK